MKTVLVTGITGQDGRLLAESLGRSKDPVKVVGTSRDASAAKDLYTTRHADIADKVDIQEVRDYKDQLPVILEALRPDEIYNLAAPTFVGDSWKDPIQSLDQIAGPLQVFLEYLRTRPEARLFHASSAEIFGLPWQVPQSETCSVRPRNPYGAAKAYAHELVGIYRNQYDLFAVSGILYNHESLYRGENFVTMKICKGVADYLVTGETLAIGNLDARRDWGCAREFVEAMRLSLNCDKARDYVFATGQNYSVRDFVECCLTAMDIPFEWQGRGLEEVAVDTRNQKDIIKVDPRFYRPLDDSPLIGNSELLQLATGWKPTRTLHDIVSEMMQEVRKS